MTITITAGTITWGANEIRDYLVATRKVDTTLATYIQSFIKWFTGTPNSGVAPFPALDRDAGLITALHNLIRPIVDVARGCWGVYGTPGSSPASVANVETWIAANRPDLLGSEEIIGDVIHYFLADAAAGDITGSGPLVKSTEIDQNVNSSTYNTAVTRTQDQYAAAVVEILTQICRFMRYFATKTKAAVTATSSAVAPLLDDSAVPQD